jgi:protocatechuate 3,4-dioxygenase beta subunit
VLVAGGGPEALALAAALAPRGVTTAILADANPRTLPAAHGLIRAHAAELGLQAARSALAAVGDGAEAAMNFAMEERADAAGLAMLSTFAPVIEGLRADLPVFCVAAAGLDARTRAGVRELAHQAALAGAAVRFADAAEPAAAAAAFLAARLLPAPARDDASAADLLELARAAADRGDGAAALQHVDRALAQHPALAATLAADHGFARLRADAGYRALLAARAPVGELRLAPEHEAGAPMHVRCRFVGPDGAPLAGIAIDAWQTDALGRYDHVRDGDGEPRLWGSVRTDAEGAFTLHSVRPGGYPATMIPAHVHLRLHLPGRAREVELLFADDPRLAHHLAERLLARGFGVARLDAQGAGSAEFRLPAAR